MTSYSSSYTGDQLLIAKAQPGADLMEPTRVAGPTVYWPDGTTSYVLSFTRGHESWTVADEAETAVSALEAIRGDEEIERSLLQAYLRGVRQLEMRMTALKEELLLYAREAGENGRSRLTFRELGDELRQHHSTVAERHQRILDGDTAAWRHWVTQGTGRATLYSNGGTLPHEDKPLREHETDVFDSQEHPGKVQARCRCGWSGSVGTNVVLAAREGAAHEHETDV
ncbi:hypothetical protein [Streptomyces rochei]|uniref:hypothetical protein n=1 Tax=Streptomyces rochei TaxID=1928 RepID=UPI0033AC56B3